LDPVFVCTESDLNRCERDDLMSRGSFIGGESQASLLSLACLDHPCKMGWVGMNRLRTESHLW